MDKYADTVNKAETGNFDEINDEHKLRYYKTIKSIMADNKVRPANLQWTDGQSPNEWIWGPSGYGKSHTARIKLGEKFYAKIAANKWWDKYAGEDNVLIEDFDVSQAYQVQYLKIWADKYAFPVEVKNGGDFIRPKKIIVTSNYSIRQIWPKKEDYEPLERRFKQVHRDVHWSKNPFGRLDAVVNTVRGDAKQVKMKDHLIPKDTDADVIEWRENEAKLKLVGDQKKKHAAAKKRKFDGPFNDPKPYKQNTTGKIVVNTSKQLKVDESMALRHLKEDIANEKDVIDISDTEDMSEDILNLGVCEHCEKNIITCVCMDSESEGDDHCDLNYDSNLISSSSDEEY